MNRYTRIKSFHITDALNEKIIRRAADTGLSDSDIIRLALNHYLGDYKPRAPRRAATSARIHTPNAAPVLES